MREEITKGLHEGKTYKQMTDAIKNSLEGDVVKAKRIVRTESHRIREEAGYESARNAHARGVKMVKVWNTVADERVRSSHDSLNGTKVDVDEDFEIDGFTAKAPGQFNEPSMDINCRCFTTFEVVAIEKTQHNELENISYSEWRKTRVN
nr:phage minor head protein [Alkalihalophilus marmarensis]